jgi:tRNA(adenine34) deaminase
MRLALDEARIARDKGEVPVGAVIVLDDVVIGRGHNAVESTHDATAHAEIMALRDAAAAFGNQRLNEATIHVTLEPCAMCIGALILSRVGTVVFGAHDPKFGACGSVVNLLSGDFAWNHSAEVIEGVMADESVELLREFFEKLRARK